MLIPVSAGAGESMLPPVGELSVKLAADHGTVELKPVQDLAGPITISIYGIDGLQIGQGDSDLVWLRLAGVRKDTPLTIPFKVTRGAGRTYIVVFADGAGRMSQRTEQVGQLSPEQIQRNNACVMQDADGRWIEVMGCDRASPAPAVVHPSVVQSAVLTGVRDASVRIDGPNVDIALAQPAFDGKCRAQRSLTAATLAPKGKQTLSWKVFTDPGCKSAATVTLAVERK
jgi:hypothetical protein